MLLDEVLVASTASDQAQPALARRSTPQRSLERFYSVADSFAAARDTPSTLHGLHVNAAYSEPVATTTAALTDSITGYQEGSASPLLREPGARVKKFRSKTSGTLLLLS